MNNLKMHLINALNTFFSPSTAFFFGLTLLFCSSCYIGPVWSEKDFFPNNFHEQIQNYFPEKQEKYLVVPVYSVNMNQLTVAAPFFDAPPFYKTRQKCRESSKGLSLGIGFFGVVRSSPCIFIFSNDGSLTAMPFFPYPVFKDFSLIVYRSFLSPKWKQQIQDVISKKKVNIEEGAWLCFSIYQYYGGCWCFAEDMDHSASEKLEILKFIDSLPAVVHDSGNWRQIWQPQTTRTNSDEIFAALKNSRCIVIEDLPINLDFSRPFYAKHVVKVNGDTLMPCTEFTGKLSSAMLEELRNGGYTTMVYLPEKSKVPSNFNDFDSLRHYCRKNGLRLFYAKRNQRKAQAMPFPWIPDDAKLYEVKL